MTYEETIDYLFAATPAFEKIGAGAYKEGLSNTLALDNHFGHPHRNYKTVHVAGTNGKGSCSHTIAAMLQAAGHKVGLYTSPHLVDFRERIRVNGQCIDRQYVVDFVEKERSFFEPLHPSFFELTTAMAFKYFAEQAVDYAVVEVGLGGRLDCTNIITPEVAVITNISYDHTQFLGHTLQDIAREKAGIMKSGVPTVVGETNAKTKPIFEKTAKEKGSTLHFAEEMTVEDTWLSRFQLKGNYQQKNLRTILCTARLLNISEEHQKEGLSYVCELTGLEGRWQTLKESPLVVCDTGHNVGGWTYLAPQIASQSCRQCRIVFGMVDDKDIESIMKMLPTDATYYWTQPGSHRAIPHSSVMEIGERNHLAGRSFADVCAATRAALSDADAQDFIFIGGSSYVVADLLTAIRSGDIVI